jgi:hypothetical protein
MKQARTGDSGVIGIDPNKDRRKSRCGLGRTAQKRMPYIGSGGLAGYNRYITGHKPIKDRK